MIPNGINGSRQVSLQSGFAAVHGTMEVTSRGSPKIPGLSKITEKQVLPRCVAAGCHLDSMAACSGELFEHAVKFPFIEIVSSRMRQNRNAFGTKNRGGCLMDRGFGSLHVAGFPTRKVLRERGVVILNIAVLGEPRREMRAPDEPRIRHNFQNPSQTPFMPSFSNFSAICTARSKRLSRIRLSSA